MKYKILQEYNLVLIKIVSEISGANVCSLLSTIALDPNFKKQMNALVDERGVNLTFSIRATLEMKQYSDILTENSPAKTAIVTNSKFKKATIQFLAKVYSGNRDFKGFVNIGDALKWLDTPPCNISVKEFLD
jgi:hypothetical protein